MWIHFLSPNWWIVLAGIICLMSHGFCLIELFSLLTYFFLHAADVTVTCLRCFSYIHLAFHLNIGTTLNFTLSMPLMTGSMCNSNGAYVFRVDTFNVHCKLEGHSVDRISLPMCEQSPLITVTKQTLVITCPVLHGMTRPSPNRNTVLPTVTWNISCNPNPIVTLAQM